MGHYASEMMSDAEYEDKQAERRKRALQVELLKRALCVVAQNEEEAKLAVELAEKIHWKLF